MLVKNMICVDCVHKEICKYRCVADKMSDEFEGELQCILDGDSSYNTCIEFSNLSFNMEFKCDHFKEDRTCNKCHFIGLNNDDCDVCKRIEKEKEEDYPLVNENGEGCCYWIKR